MKNVLKLALLTLFAAGSTAAFGQQIKLGYINSEELFLAMPERDSAVVMLETLAAELQEQLDLIRVEFNKQWQTYQKDGSTLSDAVRTMKEAELQSISTRMQESQQTAQEELQKKETELLTPVFEKLNDAVIRVAKANNMTAVFDLAARSMLYHDEAGMIDMLPLVKAELGIPN